MSDVWHPFDPEGSRPPEAPGREQGPDPEPIVRTVRVAFLLAGMVVAVMVNAVLGGAWLALRPARLLTVGKRALAHPDPRQRRPRAERARAIGFRGLAMGWAGQAMVFGLLPAFAGLVLELLYDHQWELLAFAGISLLAGFVFQLQVAGAVRLAVDDPELRASYGSR